MATKKLLPEITVPMNESAEAFEIRFEKEGVKDKRPTGLLRGIKAVDEQLTRVNEMRKKILSDRTLNETARKTEFLKYVKRTYETTFQKFQNITRAVDKHTSEISETINKPIVDESSSRDAIEIRSWVNQNIKTETERMSFIRQKIDSEDWETASALLGKKAYLSGLKPTNKEPLIQYYRKKRFEEEFKTMEALQKIGETTFQKMARLEKFKKSIADPETRDALASQNARKEFVSKS